MIDLKEVKQLIKLMKDNELTEISVQKGDDAICLKKGSEQNTILTAPVPSQAITPVVQNAAASESVSKESKLPDNIVEITSPMVGTFYRSPSPEASAYVEVGQDVEKGTVLCIVEAMKLMNEVKSEISGKIVEVLIDNAQPVEFGQAMFRINVGRQAY